MKVIDADMKAILNACGVGTDALQRNIVRNLEEYLVHIGAKTAVIEEDYVDRDYAEDYALYYSRCFCEYKRFCNRVHFFAEDLSVEAIDAMLVGDESSREQLQQHYLGFVVLRPLPTTIIGKTCLLPYEQVVTGRHYPALTDVGVSFYGLPLKVRCMPFQEQDTNVAACATCALWSAFHTVPAQFNCRILSPSHITSLSLAHGTSLARVFPNHGVGDQDMIYAVRQSGLDPLVVDIEGTEPMLRANKFLGNVYAYLCCGIPVIAITDIVKKDGFVLGCHAITINGYHLSDVSGSALGCSRELLALGIDKIYAHDDQLVPYSRIEVALGKGELELISNWKDNDDQDYRCRFAIRSIIVPLYHKIRVGYDEVWNVAYEFGSLITLYCKKLQGVSVVWDIRLTEGSDFKRELNADVDLPDADKLCVLKSSLPHYLWLVRVLVNGEESALYCIDATDAGQGLRVAAAIFLKGDLLEIAHAIDRTGRCTRNILINASI